jgi:hypothetical protein
LIPLRSMYLSEPYHARVGLFGHLVSKESIHIPNRPASLTSLADHPRKVPCHRHQILSLDPMTSFHFQTPHSDQTSSWLCKLLNFAFTHYARIQRFATP